MSRLSKLRAQAGQTHTQRETDATERITKPHSWVVKSRLWVL